MTGLLVENIGFKNTILVGIAISLIAYIMLSISFNYSLKKI